MRASEFISEANGKLTKRQQISTRGVNLFRDPNGVNSIYTLNRVMMAAASADGINVPNLPAQSWVANNMTAFPYTEEEQQILKQAYKAIGVKYTDLNKGDMRSQELATTNITSPMNSFKGYKKK